MMNVEKMREILHKQSKIILKQKKIILKWGLKIKIIQNLQVTCNRSKQIFESSVWNSDERSNTSKPTGKMAFSVEFQAELFCFKICFDLHKKWGF